jgi:hypothetical protein
MCAITSFLAWARAKVGAHAAGEDAGHAALHEAAAADGAEFGC